MRMIRSLIFLAFSLFAPASGEDAASVPEVVPVIIEGMLHLVGHEPFLRLSLETDSGEVYLTPRRSLIPESARKLVGRRVVMEGHVRSEAVRDASGKVVALERLVEITRIVPEEERRSAAR